MLILYFFIQASQQPAVEAVPDATEMLVTQHPDGNQQSAVAEDEDREETPAGERAERETNLQDLSV